MKTATARQARLEISIAAVLAGIFLLFIIGNPRVFTRFDIYYSFMSTIPFFGIMALAMTLVVTLGEMDLSFPSVLALSALVFGKVFTFTGNIWLAALVCVLIGLAAGAINALLIVRVGIPSLVATIGTMFFFRGMVNVIAQGKGIALVKAKETLFYSLAVGRIGGVFPAQAAWMLLLGVGFWILLNRHRFGSHILFVGDNMESSRMMGINVERVKTIVFMQMGFFAAFAGILSTLEVTYFWPSQGQGYLLTTLAAVFIGGTSVFGGMGTIFGTFVGAIIIGSLEAGIIAIGLTGFWIQLIYGLIIMVSVSIYAILLKKSHKNEDIRMTVDRNHYDYIVRLENLQLNYGKVEALKNISFEVKNNEIVGLIGDNGAGKSSLIKVITGVEKPTRGKLFVRDKEISFKGHSVKKVHDLGIETVYQTSSLGEKQSLWRNFFVGRQIKNGWGLIDVQKEKAIAQEMLLEKIGFRGVGITVDSPISELSGGERQGVAIGRAMYFDADLIILDEPTVALSLKEVAKVLNFVREIKDSGRSCIYIEHNMYHVYEVCDRFVILDRGEVVNVIEKHEISLNQLNEYLLSLSTKKSV